MGYTIHEGGLIAMNAFKNGSVGPLHEWKIIEEQFSVENNYKNETIFALGNGYLGMRGSFEEGYQWPSDLGFEGNFINGFYEIDKISYRETAYGYPEKGQTMLNIANGKTIRLYVEEEEFSMLEGKLLSYRRELDLKEGILSRIVHWRSPKGREAEIRIERMVSHEHKHLAVISYSVTPLNFSGNVRLISSLDGCTKNTVEQKDPRVGSGLKNDVYNHKEAIITGEVGMLKQKTHYSEFTIVSAITHTFDTKCTMNYETMVKEDQIDFIYQIEGQINKPVQLTKYIAYITSLDTEEENLIKEGQKICLLGRNLGFEKMKGEQRLFLKEFWAKADVVIKGDPALQQGIRFNIFHLMQSVGRDGKTNIAAKGLTGEGYEGHYFWDTEMYIIPFFLYSNPQISRKLLEYRYSTLNHARNRARQMAHPKGALFPWRTINGEECSAYYPAGTAQYHINADIAFAIRKYMDATEDIDFLVAYGAEILFETARLWADLGSFVPEKDNQFCINCVTGPDEYTAVVNNNCYTNLMAKENLYYAHDTAMWMKTQRPEVYEKLCMELDLKEEEILFWKEAAASMYIPYDEKRQIYMQDDSFLNKKVWDFANTPEDHYPLLLHYHPLVIYRHQVCKQADLVLAEFLLSEQFTKEQKKRDFDYYEKVTTHDSSLSKCIFSIIACEIGYFEKAYDYFMKTARMDLDDVHKNTKHGVHTANMAGSWMGIVNGFAGMRTVNGILSFSPYIPPNWEMYAFNVLYRGSTLHVTVEHDRVNYKLLEGDEITIIHNGGEIIVKGEVSCIGGDAAIRVS